MDAESVRIIIEKLDQLGQLASNTAWQWNVKMQVWYGIVGTSILSLFNLGILVLWAWFIYACNKQKDWDGSGFVFGGGGMFFIFFIVIMAIETIPRLVLPEYFALQALIPR
jgi:hypothetical protein